MLYNVFYGQLSLRWGKVFNIEEKVFYGFFINPLTGKKNSLFDRVSFLQLVFHYNYTNLSIMRIPWANATFGSWFWGVDVSLHLHHPPPLSSDYLDSQQDLSSSSEVKNRYSQRQWVRGKREGYIEIYIYIYRQVTVRQEGGGDRGRGIGGIKFRRF